MKPVCLVTGAGGRLGRDLCRALQEDYEVVATYRSRMHSHGMGIQADLTQREDIARVVETAMERHGRIDALVNAAADIAFHGSLRELWRAEDDYPQSQMLLNAIAPMQLASAIYQYCWKGQAAENARRNRSIVNVSSISGLYVFEERGQAFYGVSKAALNMLTLYLSLELAPFSVRVNAVCPARFTDPAATGRVTNAIRSLLGGAATGTIVSSFP
ncbi:NAD(P)-dependent dehydrogenase, short-chain alcohol dehydrogenase family [Duganella sp. CF458]|uniref:SDR family NAD(P)-dependent oxidoreductase n=1 Tax=Duganella sp. CF458 TaxID=1884368 RepID=UPI0008EA1887|nr:SDR family oxidoreductase [Duganella sp. CF458]SFG39745.1 NAD(P)-dependent dehydrogenase, short-chain alcohol dehydrogenase family [Duganella sp. CF458]